MTVQELPEDFPFVIDFAQSLYFHREGSGLLTGMSNPNEKIGDDHRLDIRIPNDKNHLLVHKGSIAIDGISLTIAEIDENNLILTCWITPHTHSNTHLINAKNGDLVNLEFDLIAKHLEKIVDSRAS